MKTTEPTIDGNTRVWPLGLVRKTTDEALQDLIGILKMGLTIAPDVEEPARRHITGALLSVQGRIIEGVRQYLAEHGQLCEVCPEHGQAHYAAFVWEHETGRLHHNCAVHRPKELTQAGLPPEATKGAGWRRLGPSDTHALVTLVEAFDSEVRRSAPKLATCGAKPGGDACPHDPVGLVCENAPGHEGETHSCTRNNALYQWRTGRAVHAISHLAWYAAYGGMFGPLHEAPAAARAWAELESFKKAVPPAVKSEEAPVSETPPSNALRDLADVWMLEVVEADGNPCSPEAGQRIARVIVGPQAMKDPKP